jgi:hypothetical protein
LWIRHWRLSLSSSHHSVCYTNVVGVGVHLQIRERFVKQGYSEKVFVPMFDPESKKEFSQFWQQMRTHFLCNQRMSRRCRTSSWRWITPLLS